MGPDKPRPPSRPELAKFLPTERAIRAFEQLFDIVPSGIYDAEDAAATAYIAAVDALSGIAEVLALIGPAVLDPAAREPVELAETVEGLALAPAPEALDMEAPYGELYADNAGIVVAVAVVDTAYEVASGITGGLTNLMTFGGSHYLEMLRNGTYRVDWSMSVIGNVVPGDEIEGGFMVDGVAQSNATGHGGGMATPSMISGTGLVALNPSQQVSLYVSNHSAARDIDVEHVSLTLERINPWPSQ